MGVKKGGRVSPSAAAVSRLPGGRLARLLEPELSVEWSVADGAAALRGQLGAALLPDLLGAPGADEGFLRKRVAAMGRGGAGVTFGKLLAAKGADVELLRAVKALAAHLREEGESPLRGDPATVLYYAAIAAGLLRGERITSLSEEKLREGLAWAAGQEVPAGLKRVIAAALKGLGDQ